MLKEVEGDGEGGGGGDDGGDGGEVRRIAMLVVAAEAGDDEADAGKDHDSPLSRPGRHRAGDVDMRSPGPRPARLRMLVVLVVGEGGAEDVGVMLFPPRFSFVWRSRASATCAWCCRALPTTNRQRPAQTRMSTTSRNGTLHNHHERESSTGVGAAAGGEEKEEEEEAIAVLERASLAGSDRQCTANRRKYSTNGAIAANK